MSDDLWQKLSVYHIYPLVNSKIVNPDVLFVHSNNFVIFDINVFFALLFYQEIIEYERKLDDKIPFGYIPHKDNAIIRLVTSLEVYLVDSFKIISNSITLDNVKLVDFVKTFRREDQYNALKTTNRKIILDDILPKRLDLQQKDKCKKAYSLIDIDVMNVAGKNQPNTLELWDKIFNKSDGYIQTRNRIVHRGIARTHNDINADYIKAAALDIANFIYNLELKINSKYPKSNYPEIYPETNTGHGVKLLNISSGY